MKSSDEQKSNSVLSGRDDRSDKRHTAMRWHFSPTHGGQAYDIGADDGSNIALVYGPKDGGPPDFLRVARLISASPAMLLALKEKLAADDAMLAFILVAQPEALDEDEWDRQHKALAERRRAATAGMIAAIAMVEGQ